VVIYFCVDKLACGSHKCEEPCHRGKCPPCWQVSFDELRCECGAEVIYPPVPCGTAPLPCSRPCTRPQSCGHKVRQLLCLLLLFVVANKPQFYSSFDTSLHLVIFVHKGFILCETFIALSGLQKHSYIYKADQKQKYKSLPDIFTIIDKTAVAGGIFNTKPFS